MMFLDEDVLAVLFWASCFFTGLVIADMLLSARTRRRFVMDALLVLLSGMLLLFFKISDGYTGAGVNEATWYHLALGTTGLTWGQLDGIVRDVLFYAFIFGALLWAAHRARKFRQARPSTRSVNALHAGLMLSLVYVLALGVNPASVQGATMLVSRMHQGEYQRQLNANAIAPSGTIVAPVRPKSVVYIYGESMEATFMDEDVFPGLMPNLSALRKESFSLEGLRQAPYTGWTIAGIIASQCGFPALGDQAYSRGTNTASLVCVPDILHDAGYTLSYLNGADITFAGKNHFFGAHQFDRVRGRDELLAEMGPREMSRWGIFDDDLFGKVEEEYDRLLATKKPFFLATLTVDTHPPVGHKNPACRKYPSYSNGENEMLDSVHCSDRLIGELVRRLRARHAKDVVIIIGSDHLQSAQSSLANTMLRANEDRRHNLWLAIGDDIAPGKNYREGTTFDIAPTLLSMLGFDVPALHLGRDLNRPAQTLSEKFGRAGYFTRVSSAFSMGTHGQWEQVVKNPTQTRPRLTLKTASPSHSQDPGKVSH